jgi:putative N6-adenine-specific DNA methylase
MHRHHQRYPHEPTQLFLPCAAGVEGFLADEVHGITGLTGNDLLVGRGGVLLQPGARRCS